MNGTPAPWNVDVDGLTFELRLAPAGQVGLFPEQAPNWKWLADRARATKAGQEPEPVIVLNLFAYTGAATIALAAAGASVVHVDASRPAVAWARRNAELNRLAERPIRWLVDDVMAFLARELRRGHRYDGIVLDPPSYGHGAGRGVWRLQDHLDGLLVACQEVSRPRLFVLLSAHTSGFDDHRLGDALRAAFGAGDAVVEGQPLELTARSGTRLPLGACARLFRA